MKEDVRELVERLRELYAEHSGGVADACADGCDDAADALEAQQAEMEKRLRQQGSAWAADAKRKNAKIEQLRGLLREARPFVKVMCDHDDNGCGCHQHTVLRGIDAALGEGTP